MKCKCGNEYEKNKSYLCLPCRRIYSRAWREKRQALGLKVRGKKPSLAWFKSYWQKYYRRKDVRKKRAELMQKYRNDPRLRDRHAARWITNRAIKTGRLHREPCRDCNFMKVDAHHPDYGKPLQVIWLCRPCHIREHAKAEGRI